MNFSPFSCPIFLGHAEARAAASKASGCFMGGTHDVCDLNHRLAISEASVGRKKSCSQLRLKVRGWVVFAIRSPYAISDGSVLVAQLNASPPTGYTFRCAKVSSCLHGTIGPLHGSATPSTRP